MNTRTQADNRPRAPWLVRAFPELAVGVILVTGLVTLSSCAVMARPGHGRPVAARQAVVYVTEAPPPPRVEVIPPRPAARAAWTGGHWAWRNGAYAWSPGRWERNPRGAWTAGRWTHQPRGWVWTPGRWQR